MFYVIVLQYPVGWLLPKYAFLLLLVIIFILGLRYHHVIEKSLIKQLEGLNQKLVVSNQELQDFAYVISHDLKAPLHAIKMVLDLTIQDNMQSISSETKNVTNQVYQKINIMTDLIEGILEYSSIGIVEAEFKLIDLNLLLQKIIESLNPPKSMKIEISTILPQLKYPEIRIHQLFQNLLALYTRQEDIKENEIVSAFTRSLYAFVSFYRLFYLKPFCFE